MNAARQEVAAMPKKQFHKTVFRNVASRREFSRLMSGLEYASEDDKATLRAMLAKNGVSSATDCTDEELKELCHAIMARAVKLT